MCTYICCVVSRLCVLIQLLCSEQIMRAHLFVIQQADSLYSFDYCVASRSCVLIQLLCSEQIVFAHLFVI